MSDPVGVAEQLRSTAEVLAGVATDEVSHHPLLHEGGWDLQRDEHGRPLWYTPDGILLDPRPGWSHKIA